MSTKHTKLYDILGVDPKSSLEEIKKAFKKLAIKWHPDKWSNATDQEKTTADAKFKEISEAYGILTDSKKREMYDRYGEDALKSGGGPTEMNEEDMADLFGGMGIPFGGMFGRNTRQKKLKFPNIKHEFNVTLKDVCFGTNIAFEITRYNLKKDKQPSKSDMECSDCKGSGVKLRVVQMGPGMISQQQEKCKLCNGDGICFPESFFEKKVQKFSRSVPKGIYEGETLIIENNGHELPDCYKDDFPNQERSNIVLIVHEIENEEKDTVKYSRGVDGSMFNVRTEITLQPHETICGTIIKLKYIDGNDITVKIPPGIVFTRGKSPDCVVIIPKLGTPYYRQKNTFGDLYIIVKIDTSKFLTDIANNEHKLSQLWKIMSDTNKPNNSEDKSAESTESTEPINSIPLETFIDSKEHKESVKNFHNYKRMKLNNDDNDNDDSGPNFGPRFGGNFGGQPAQCVHQ